MILGFKLLPAFPGACQLRIGGRGLSGRILQGSEAEQGVRNQDADHRAERKSGSRAPVITMLARFDLPSNPKISAEF